MEPKADLSKFHQILIECFNDTELRQLCLYLDIDYEILSGKSKVDRAIELLLYLKRHDRMPDLATAGKKLRPDLSWDDAFEMGTLPQIPVKIPETILIPAGPFWMGSPGDDPSAHGNETPRHERFVGDFLISRYPVTNAQYAEFVSVAGHPAPEHWHEKRVLIGLKDHPVVNVSFEDAAAYCRWLSQITGETYRLPTEAEWEKAARGGMPETRQYPWGDPWQPTCCNTKAFGCKNTTAVYAFEQVNQSPFGVVDMSGNVWEWTTSWYEGYPGTHYTSPNFGQKCRVVRGGSWNHSSRDARISWRGRYKPDVRRPYLGFRAVLEPSVSVTD